jgi:hypothetical protein
MTLTEQPSTRMVVFQNVVFENDNGCDNRNSMISVGLPIKQSAVQRPNVLLRLSKRLSNLSHSTAPINNFPSIPSPQPITVVLPPPSSSLERQHSSESDLSLSKLDITDEYSGVGGTESLNTSRQTSELDITGRKTSFSTTSQRFVEPFRNFYSRFSQKRSLTKTNTSSNTIITNPSLSTFDTTTRLTGNFSISNRKSIFEHNFFSCCSNCFFTRNQSSPSDVTIPHRRSFLF